jgi:hypothetical protein
MRLLAIQVAPHVGPLHLTIKAHCEACGREFTQVAGTVGCLPVFRLTCPGCGLTVNLEPETAFSVIARFVPHLDAVQAEAMIESSNAILEQWHVVSPWREAVCSSGHDLGKNAEYDLNGILSLALYTAVAAKDKG